MAGCSSLACSRVTLHTYRTGPCKNGAPQALDEREDTPASPEIDRLCLAELGPFSPDHTLQDLPLILV